MMSGSQARVNMADIRDINEFKGKRRVRDTRVDSIRRHPSDSPLAEIVELDQYRDEVISVEVDSTEKAAEEEPVRPSTHRTVL